MRREKLRFILIVLLVVYVIMQDVGIGTASPEGTVFSVDPPMIIEDVGQTFDINVTVENVEDLYGWGCNLTFRPGVLQVLGPVAYSSWMTDNSGFPAVPAGATTIDNSAGYVTMGQILHPAFNPTNGATGTGSLVTVTFNVTSVGATYIDLTSSKLNTEDEGINVPIPHVTENGIFDNRGVENDPPVAIFDADPLAQEIGEEIVFNGSASYDPNDWLFSYYWDFGDGKNATGIIEHGKGKKTELEKVKIYGQSGIYTVALAVTDYYGATDTTTVDVAVGHDIAITSIEIPYTVAIPGVQVPINVTVVNERGFNETSNVTAYYDNTVINMTTVNLDPLEETIATFTWNTTNLPEGDYTITVEASNVTNEINIANNMKNRTITLAAFNLVSHPVEVGGFTFHVITKSNSTISNFDFIRADKKIRFDLAGENGTNGFCNVTVPKNLLNAPLDEWTVLVDDAIPPQLTLTENATHTFIHITYAHSTHTVQIIGKTVATPPVAAFTQHPETPIVDEIVVFNSTSYDPDGTITHWEWDLDGDGNIDAYTENTTYIYTATGTYTATLTVMDDIGLTNSTELSLKVLDYPNAVFTYSPQNPIVGTTITFNASASYDTDGWIASYTWDFDDGNVTTINNATTVITHAFATARDYTVILNVTDNDGLTNTNTQSVTIERMNSTISITLSTTSITVDENTSLSGSIDPVRSGVTVTIWYRSNGEETWNTVTTLTDDNSQYLYIWTPESAGTYEIKASWEGDENTFADETEVQELTVQEAAQPSGPTVPLYLIAIIAAIVVAIVIIAGYFIKTRKPT